VRFTDTKEAGSIPADGFDDGLSDFIQFAGIQFTDDSRDKAVVGGEQLAWPCVTVFGEAAPAKVFDGIDRDSFAVAIVLAGDLAQDDVVAVIACGHHHSGAQLTAGQIGKREVYED
jgi:hypothetical protein